MRDNFITYLLKKRLHFTKRFPSKAIYTKVQLDFIYHGHGIDESNHMQPHSHLFDSLQVEEIPLTPHQQKMYVRQMTDKHFLALLEHGKSVRYHAHGGVNEKPAHYVSHLEYNDSICRAKEKAKLFSVITAICLTTFVYAFAVHLFYH